MTMPVYRLRMTEELDRRVSSLAAVLDVSMNTLICRVVEDHLASLDEVHASAVKAVYWFRYEREKGEP